METVVVSIRNHTSSDSLQSWLDNHGMYVTRLRVSCWSKTATLALLACQHLQQLELEGIDMVVVLEPNSQNSHGIGHPVPLKAVTKLHLFNCTVAGGLSVLTALKELEVTDTVGPCFPGSPFQHYRLLTRLELNVKAVTDLHFISCLVSLQQLTDWRNSNPSIAYVTRGLLPGGLPASLRVLKLRPTVLDPVVLLGLTNLQQLWLAGSVNDFELAGGSAVLLDAIAAMQQLEELQLFNVRCDWPPPPSAAAYSSLTASSNLTCLQLEDCRLPAAASERMLPPAGTLHKFAMVDSEGGSAVLPWKAQDVDRLVMHCPTLRSIGLGLELSDDLVRLTQLSALTSLEARFAGELDDGMFIPEDSALDIVYDATKLTGLRHLRLCFAETVNMATLLQLTALRQLTQLCVEAWTDLTDDWEDIYLSSLARPPDVWLELLKVCAEHPGCHNIIVPDLVYQQAQLQQQQMQLAEQVELQQQQQASALSAATAAQDEAAAARTEAAAARAQASAAETAASAARAQASAAEAVASAARADANAAQAAANAARADAAELRDQLAALQAAVRHLVHPQATE